MTGTILTKTRDWYESRLYDFFINHFANAKDAEFFDAPHKNQYAFDFPDMKKRIILTCNDDESVTQEECYFASKKEFEKTANNLDAAVGDEKYADYFYTECVGKAATKFTLNYSAKECALAKALSL